MSNILIAHGDLIDGADVTTDSEVTGMEASHVLSMQPTDIWRFQPPGTAYIQLDLKSQKTFDFVGAFVTSIPPHASNTWRIRTAILSTDLITNPIYDSGIQQMVDSGVSDKYGYYHALHVMSGDVTSQYVRIDFAISVYPPSFYLDIGRIYVSKSWVPEINLTYGWGVGYKDDSRQVRSLGGHTYTNNSNPYRLIDFRLDFQSEDELYGNAFAMDRDRGRSRDVFVCVDRSNAARFMDYSIYGLQSDLDPIVNNKFALFRKQMQIQELI